MEGRTPAHFSSSGQGQAEGRAMPVSHPAHHHIASTCVGERRGRRRAGGTSSQAGRLCCSYCRYYRYCHLGLGCCPTGVPQGGQFCPRGTWTSSRASRLHPSPSPQNSPASSRLCTSLHHWPQCQALLGFIFESEAREVPFGGKRKKSIFQPQRAESQVPAPKYLREERRAAASGSGLLQDSFSSVYLENISALRSHPARRSPARPPSA